MIKRRFYRHEHGDRNDASDSSSSSSDSELEAESAEETEAEDDVAEVREYRESHSSSSGYESEDSSANGVDVDSSGLLTNDDDFGTRNDGQNFIKSHSSSKSDADIVDMLSNTVAEKDSVPSEVDCILKCKSVFRCRLCPRIVCLTEETLKTHLKSKRHARSEKLLSDGRLKLMLNSDGEIEEEEDGETHAERHARIVAATQNSANPKKKNKGRQRQRKRLRKKEKGKDTNLDKGKRSTKSPAKKRHKSDN